MRLKLRRRSVYIGTIVAMFAMIAGVAMAAAFGSIGGYTAQSGYSTTITASAWAGTVTVQGVADSSQSGCTSSTTLVGATPTYFAAASGADQCVAGDFYEEISLSPSTAVPDSTAAKFTIYADAADATYDIGPITLTTQSGGPTSSLDIYVDFTSSGGVPDLPTSLAIVVQN